MSQKRTSSFALPPSKRKKANTSFGSRYVSSLLGSSQKRPAPRKSISFLRKPVGVQRFPVTLNRAPTRTINRYSTSAFSKKPIGVRSLPSSPFIRNQTQSNSNTVTKPTSKKVCQVCFRDFSPHIILGNQMLECCICRITVHPICYGKQNSVSLPTWFCDKCESGAHHAPKCKICGLSTAGAFKPVEGGGWAHLVCAMWVPNTYVKSTKTMSPVAGLEDIVKERKALTCTYCGLPGNCIQCNSKKCTTAFHVLCAQKVDSKLLVTVSLHNKKLFAFCEKHHPHRKRRFRTPKICLQADEDDDSEDESDSELGRKMKKSKAAKSVTKFRCSQCGKPFKTEGTRKRHAKGCTATSWLPQYRGGDLRIRTLRSKGMESISPIKCPYCPLTVVAGTSARGEMFQHIFSVHHKQQFQPVAPYTPYLLRRNISTQNILELVDDKLQQIEDELAEETETDEPPQ